MRTIGALALLVAGFNIAFAGEEIVDLDGVKSKAPADWKTQKPSNKLRKYQFSLPKADGDPEDGDLAIFAIGGSKEDNVKRWKAAFLAPKGKSIDDVSKSEEFKVGKAEVYILDITGTFKYKKSPQDPREKEQLKEDYRRLAVIFDVNETRYTMTLVGPAKTVAKHKDSFDKWIKAFK